MNNSTKIESNCDCFSMISPSILENLARNEIREAKTTISQSKTVLKERANWPGNKESGLKASIPAGKSNRIIFDSNNSWEKEVKLVRREGDAPVQDDDVNNAYDYMGYFRDYLNKNLNRNSLDDNGMDMISNVHFGVKFFNALWNGKQMILGDGDGIIFTNFAKSLDVIAHELGHGVAQYANFEYYNQPGALHEHFADVFGTVVTQDAEGQTADTADWLIGDEIMGPELYGEALLCMSEPGTAYDNILMGKDPQPNHMKYFYKGPEDHGGVHINNGIMNKAFYLTSKEIGTDQAALVWFTALRNLWPTANFNEAFGQVVAASKALVKAKKISEVSTQKVRTAFGQVGLPY